MMLIHTALAEVAPADESDRTEYQSKQTVFDIPIVDTPIETENWGYGS